MRTFFFLIPIAGTLLLGSCMVGPNYTPPVVNVKSAFDEAAQTTSVNPTSQPSHATTAASPTVEWWRTFDDPELNHLVDQALQSNFDVQIATARILQSRAQRNITSADLFPDLNATAGYNHAHGSKNVVLPLGGASGAGAAGASGGATSGAGTGAARPLAQQARAEPPAGSSAGAAAPPLTPFGQGGLPGASTDLFQAGFDASWEIDVFGGTRRRVEAANATLAAAIENRRDVTLSLLAEVTRNYVALRGTQRRLAVAQNNLAADREILEVTQSARRSGLITQLDVTRAAGEVATTAAQIPPLDSKVRLSIHALSILLSQDPTALSKELEISTPLPRTPPTVPLGLPSELLRRRPDIRRAERQLAAATAQIGTATADLFPQFSLTGSMGLDSSDASHLLDWQSHYFLISPTVSWPIFDAGRIVSNISLQKANQQEAVLIYRKAVLTALKDVEDSLVNYATEQARHAALANAADQARQAVDIARQQYRQGLVDFLNVLDAQRTQFAAEDALAQSDQTVLTNLVALYKSLGGGWEIEK